MKQLIALLMCAALPGAMLAEIPVIRVFIEPQEGFDSYISAAIVKKNVPVVVTTSREDAAYIITSVVTQKEESTGSKIARCAFAYCAGMNGSQTATVQMIDAKTKDVAWAYNVRKGGSANFQSSAEAIAKHLKQHLEKQRR
jgi:hypothetical protein